MKVRSVSLPEDLDQQAEQAALRDGRTYSNWLRRLLERELASETSGASPAGRRNPVEIMAGAPSSGATQLSALQSIADHYKERR